MTSYDIFYGEFIENCETDDINLPNTDEKRYNAIHSAIKHFNNRMSDTLSYDDITEEVDRDLTDSEIILLAHYLRLSFLEKQLIHLTTTYNPFMKEIGIKNFKDITSNLDSLIKRELNTIEKIKINSDEDYM